MSEREDVPELVNYLVNALETISKLEDINSFTYDEYGNVDVEIETNESDLEETLTRTLNVGKTLGRLQAAKFATRVLHKMKEGSQ